MVKETEEIMEALRYIEWLESEQEGLEPDDIDYISLQFEINWNYRNIESLKEKMRSGG